MNFPQSSDAIPLIGTTLGGVVVGVFAANGFTAFRCGLEWETLAAGALGLVGGLLAYRAATTQQRAIEERNAFSFGVRTDSQRKQGIAAINEVLQTRFDGNFYSAAGTFLRNAVPEIQKALVGNEPLPRDLAKMVARTSHLLIAIVAHIEAVEKRRAAIPTIANTPCDRTSDAPRLRENFERLISCLHEMDEYFRFPHEHLLGSSS
ncbi:hypothetical protein [Thalassospira povalilytica]|uniref:Uncharacterized protein n=1 Tax=Thalassospira povalilytica TaxID=732237 RepID=A0ABX4R4Z7_9PROT|nr:hypothetical protein [Thalassospira povalilytica]PKR48177.1 hypothetical protein CU041_15810 [Thalassospira povalilytica]